MNVGEKVWITNATTRYPWKPDLVGQSGVVEEVTEKYLRIRFVEIDGEPFLVWFAKDCVEQQVEEVGA